MIKKFYILLFILILFACDERANSGKELKNDFSSIPRIISTKSDKNEIFEIAHFSGLFGELIYLGGVKDTITPSKMPFDILGPSEMDEKGNIIMKSATKGDFHNYMIFHYEDISEKDLIWIDSANLSLHIDTNQILEHDRHKTIGYPLFVKNDDKKDVGLGNEYTYAPVSLEMLDNKGKWVELLPPQGLMCGYQVNSFLLPPKEIAIVVIPKTKGIERRKCRVRLGQNVSNEFYQYVNKQTLYNTRYKK